MYYVYIIFSKKLNKKYIGYSTNLSKRIKDHMNGSTPFTAKAKDWQLIYYEVFANKKDAIEEEKFLKTGKGRERLKLLLKNTLD